MAANRERRRIRVTGVVQGVGFRPFVYGLAVRHGLSGFVLNDGEGVLLEAEGPPELLEAFVRGLAEEAPPLARVESVAAETVPSTGDGGFTIETSAPTGRTALIPADVATCDDCLRELFDPADRRYRYPFVNCTQCGPRFTIVRAVPYDRPNTTMAGFPLCADCRREYEDPLDRRFHAEPIACPVCGPRLSMPLEEAVALLRSGGVLAVKGLGGYHLACDATAEEAVAHLRARKRREEKPFALMTPEPGLVADLQPADVELLHARERPIVLVRAREGGPISPSVAPGTPWLGVMLPYTPLHHLLCADVGVPLVMTSGNLSDEPIAIDDDEARSRLGGIADAFLAHDRPIHRRCEDSVVRPSFPLRRSRGYAPEALPLPVAAVRPLVAAGAELKSTFCVARGAEAFLSPHLGDLEGELAYRAFLDDLALYLEMLDVRPELIVHDLHPEYLATKWALEQDAELVGVQHHHAHAAACLAEHGETGPALALVFDGTGYGTDGTLWGGELLRCDLAEFERVAHLEPVPLPGGEAAVREPWRTAAIHLERAGLPVADERWPLVRNTLAVNAPLSSGMGRLFDAAASVLGVRDEISYEGQAAIELEQLAGETSAAPYEWAFGDGPALVALVQADLAEGRPRDEIAAAFHETVAARRGGRLHGRRGASRRLPHRRNVPEPPPARLHPRPARGRRIPRAVAPPRPAERRRDQLRAGGRRRSAVGLVPAEAVGRDVRRIDPGLLERGRHRVRHLGRPGDHERRAGQLVADVVAEEAGVEPPRLACPARILRHGQDQADVLVRAGDVLELVEERGRLAVAVRVDQRHAIPGARVLDVPEHGAEGGDPDPAGDEDQQPRRVLRQDEVALRLLDLDLGPDGELGERALEGAVAEPCAEPDHAALGRRCDRRDVTARALLVLVRRVQQLDPEVLAGAVVERLVAQVEDDEERPLRHLLLLLDRRAHGQDPVIPWAFPDGRYTGPSGPTAQSSWGQGASSGCQIEPRVPIERRRRSPGPISAGKPSAIA